MSKENPEPPILFPREAPSNFQSGQAAETVADFESQLRECLERGELSIQTFDRLLTSHRRTLAARTQNAVPAKPYIPGSYSPDLFAAHSVPTSNYSWNIPSPQARVPNIYPRFEETIWNTLREALEEKTYGAPRVFDLFTLMAVTLAFGLLFALLKALGASEEVFICTTVFVTIVAICQMVMFNGDKPRLASLVGGPIALFFVLVGLGLLYRNSMPVGFIIVLPAPFGIPAGYLTGGVVAGVFLLADAFRKRYGKETVENESECSELDDVVPSTKQNH